MCSDTTDQQEGGRNEKRGAHLFGPLH